MKSIVTAIIIIWSSLLFAQHCDYTVAKYSYQSDLNQFIGTSLDYQNIEDSLFVDVFYPVGSTEAKKPCVVWFFGGGFVSGTRQSMHKNCIEWAKRGFVAVTADYRLGFHGNIFPYDEAEVVRAGYRGMQDAKAAIRFIKAKHVHYGIDGDRLWVGGESAGGFVALASAFINEASEKPAATRELSAVNGQARPDLGPVEGNLLVNGYDVKVQGVFNYYGGVLDTNNIQLNDGVALFSYHQTLDGIVACDAKKPYWSISQLTNFPIAYGTCSMETRLKNISYPSPLWETWIYTGNQHAVHNQALVDAFMLQNANPILCGTTKTDNVNSFQYVELVPNPAQDNVKFDQLEDIVDCSIFNLQGKLIRYQKLIQPSINILDIESGYYFVRISKENSSKTFRLIISK
ncbi:MAG TPA: carboxylesterase family protein [Saprospiraceae bacterium]|nr:carboxylesterase family protein [Saprospiraceae bacterium]